MKNILVILLAMAVGAGVLAAPAPPPRRSPTPVDQLMVRVGDVLYMVDSRWDYEAGCLEKWVIRVDVVAVPAATGSSAMICYYHPWRQCTYYRLLPTTYKLFKTELEAKRYMNTPW